MPKLDLYVCDTETTGLDPKIHDVIEVSILRLKDDVHKTWYIKPTNFETISLEALEVNKIKIEDLRRDPNSISEHEKSLGVRAYRDVKNVLPEIENFIVEAGSSTHDRILVGHNIVFDLEMLIEMWRKAGAEDTFPFVKHGNLIDTKCLAIFYDFIRNSDVNTYNLGACIKRFGLKKRGFHEGSEDVKATKDLLMKMAEELGNSYEPEVKEKKEEEKRTTPHEPTEAEIDHAKMEEVMNKMLTGEDVREYKKVAKVLGEYIKDRLNG